MTLANMSQLRRSASTVCRELARNRLGALPYASHSAQMNAAGRRVAGRPAAKLDPQGIGGSVVLTMLDWKWSPQQIAGTLKRVFADESIRCVSHERIYTAPDHLLLAPRAQHPHAALAGR